MLHWTIPVLLPAQQSRRAARGARASGHPAAAAAVVHHPQRRQPDQHRQQARAERGRHPQAQPPPAGGGHRGAHCSRAPLLPRTSLSGSSLSRAASGASAAPVVVGVVAVPGRARHEEPRSGACCARLGRGGERTRGAQKERRGEDVQIALCVSPLAPAPTTFPSSSRPSRLASTCCCRLPSCPRATAKSWTAFTPVACATTPFARRAPPS